MDVLDISQKMHNPELTQTQHKCNGCLDFKWLCNSGKGKFSSLLPHRSDLLASAFLKGRENDAVAS